jgi:hypothetical protein
MLSGVREATVSGVLADLLSLESIAAGAGRLEVRASVRDVTSRALNL